MSRRGVGLALLLWAHPLAGQSVLERSPNLQGTWTLERGNAVFVFAHRFQFFNGGDEMVNYPTLTLALGLPIGFTAGLDYTSYSEVVPGRVSGNETQYWLKRAFPLAGHTTLAGLVAYNSAAESVDGALSSRHRLGPVALFGELRGFSSRFGSGEGGVAGAFGAALRVTEYLSLTGDVARVLSEDSIPFTWSAAAAVGIPGTPHTFSLQVANAGAITLQGVSRETPQGDDKVRYGFTFTVPLGTGSQWARIFRPAPPAPAPAADSTVAARVEIRQVAYSPQEIRIRVGQSVEWVNRDPIAHTVTANDRRWGSELLEEGGRYVRRFDRPGRYPYFCIPHPMMTGMVVVEEG